MGMRIASGQVTVLPAFREIFRSLFWGALKENCPSSLVFPRNNSFPELSSTFIIEYFFANDNANLFAFRLIPLAIIAWKLFFLHFLQVLGLKRQFPAPLPAQHHFYSNRLRQ